MWALVGTVVFSRMVGISVIGPHLLAPLYAEPCPGWPICYVLSTRDYYKSTLPIRCIAP